ncbi:MAG: RHS repeat-associated core domain-containing protein, partial [Flavobacteriales bacterium]|nr:RHS repeat-associated core domain-containing protein [Flavobacteriales bacterium]
WKTSSDNIHRGYGYEYDKLNRLTNAYFGTNHQINNHFNEHLSYDKNGNITTLQRTGNVDGFEQVIDDLTYDYIGNQLQSVTDAPIANAHFGFVDGNQQGDDYQYDMFGNMTQDLNKDIIGIKYNHLNLPIRIRFANGGEINYLYNALGVKVKKEVLNFSGTTSITDYIDAFQYNNDALQFFPHAEGYINVLKNGDNVSDLVFDYVYQYKDHLGNIRLNYLKDGETLKVLEENHYYPFGLKHTYNYSKFSPILEEDDSGIKNRRVRQVPNSGYQYKYNGKEWQDELGLNFYDYHARNYDPAIGRWMNVDPLAENSRRWNPYNYAYNNPIYFIDPDGMQSQEFNGSSAFTLSSGGFSEDVEVDTMVDMGYGRVVSSRHLTGAVNFSGGDLRITGGGKKGKGDKDKKTKEADEIRAKEIWKKETAEQDNNYNFFYKTEDNALRFSAENLNDGGANSKTISINTHGNHKIVSTPNGQMGPKALHNYLYKNNNLYRQSYDNKTIIDINIMACKTGNQFAQQLSLINPYLNVKAPTTNIEGVFNTIKNDGKWVIYNNGILIE